MDKKDIAAALEEIGTLLDLAGENPFKVRAYQNAARAIEQIPGNLDDAVVSGKLREVKGIGEGISQKIAELHATGSLGYLDELRAKIEPGLLEMLKIHGLGPKRIRLIRETLGITTLGELEYACKENRLKLLEGFGEKLQENVLRGIEDLKKYKDRHLWVEAHHAAEQVITLLGGVRGVSDPQAAGSLRRCRETVGDIDVLAAVEPKDRARVAAALTGSKLAASVIGSGDTKVSFRTPHGLGCDVRMITRAEYPYTLHHLTGSKDHNAAMRGRAQKLGFKMNEYGLYKGERLVPCASEDEIFAALKLQYIPPELRENMGEIEAAESDAIPALLQKDDLLGVMHVHTSWSDGRNPLDEMVRAAKDLGFSYVGIADHSRSAAYAGGLSPERVREQRKEVRAAEDRIGVRVLFGIESDILPDGSLDYDKKTLDLFDFVIGSVHSKFNMERGEMTRRILKAMEDPHLSMVGHLTGRLLLAREPYEVDQEVVLHAAARFGVVMELNANPNRLDLDWRILRQAAGLGVLVSINPDAHEVEGLSDTFLGVGIARKGWLSAKDVLNTRSAKEALERMKRN
ncbi:MAG: DNA polymerase/3'-5' exonuclease PolX [Deltaproteobacteria bacterium]|nr:DNA polymerase/3'-5' exonuclease PolX [Deltaproteobacteria bacterium]